MRIHSVIAGLIALVAALLVGTIPSSALTTAPWGSTTALTGAEAKAATSYPGVLTAYAGMSEQSGTERINGRKYAWRSWSNSFSGDLTVWKGKELPYPFYASGYQWPDAATARLVYANHFAPTDDAVVMTVISGTRAGNSAIFLWQAAEGPQWMTGIQTKGRYVASVGCSRPYSAVDSQNRPKAVTVAVRNAMKACVVDLLAKQVAKLPAA